MSLSTTEDLHGIPECTPQRFRSTFDAPGAAREASPFSRETLLRAVPLAHREDRIAGGADPASLRGRAAALPGPRASRGAYRAPGRRKGALLSDPIIARLTNVGEARLVQSLLETYGIPSTLSCDVPNLVYPNNVGEIRVSVPPALEDQASRILAEQRERIAPLMAAALAGDGVRAISSPVPFFLSPMAIPLAASPFSDEEEEEEEDGDDEDEWDDEDDDGGDEDEEGEPAGMDDENVAEGEDDFDDDDDDLFDDEE